MTKVTLQPIQAEFCDINIAYVSGKSWAKYARVSEARRKARQAAKRPSTAKITVRICTAAATVEKVNYHQWATHTWTPETGWATTVTDDTNNGQGV